MLLGTGRQTKLEGVIHWVVSSPEPRTFWDQKGGNLLIPHRMNPETIISTLLGTHIGTVIFKESAVEVACDTVPRAAVAKGVLDCLLRLPSLKALRLFATHIRSISSLHPFFDIRVHAATRVPIDPKVGSCHGGARNCQQVEQRLQADVRFVMTTTHKNANIKVVWQYSNASSFKL